MIFVTVGTTEFPFDRLLNAVDKVMIKLHTNEELVVQTGTSSYKFTYSKTQVFEELPFNKMIFCLKKARVVVTHGGPATIFLALKYSFNNPVVVPRSGELKEHVNEHQCLFASSLVNINGVKVIFPGDDLKKELDIYFQNPKIKLSRDNFAPAENLIRNLVKFTENINV